MALPCSRATEQTLSCYSLPQVNPSRNNPVFLSDAEQKKALKALRKRLGITGATPITGGEINALPVGTFLLKHGESLRNFVPADRPIGFLRVNEDRTGWIQSVLGSGGGYSTWASPGGILEVVPFTPALLASMADVPPHGEVAFIPVPHAAGYGKADTKAWVRWLGAAVVEEGSEARQALQDTIENAVGSEVKIGKIGWRPGGLHRVTVQFEEPGKIEPMDFLMNGNNTVSYKIEVKKNGQRYGGVWSLQAQVRRRRRRQGAAPERLRCPSLGCPEQAGGSFLSGERSPQRPNSL